MDHTPQKKNDPKAKRTYLFAGLVAAVFVFAALTFTIAGHKTHRNFASFSGVPENTAIEALLETKNGADILSVSAGGINLPDNIKEKIAAPYRLSASLKLGNGEYRDLGLSVGKNRELLTFSADGFHAQDEVTLSLNGKNIYTKIPMDWSGRIELQTGLPEGKSLDACISISGQTESIGICHAIPEGRSV
jgi:hypothetical protein